MKLNINEKALEYTDGYFITTEGRVFSSKSDKFLKLFIRKHKYLGYPEFKLNGIKTLRVHRCVAELFIPRMEGKDQVNHIDGNKTNNNIENLEWVSQTENQIHSWETGLRKMTDEHKEKLSISNQGKGAKITEDNVREIFELFNSGIDQKYIGVKFNVNRKHISAILCGKYWKHLKLKKNREVSSGGSSKIIIDTATASRIKLDRENGMILKELSKKYKMSIYIINRALVI